MASLASCIKKAGKFLSPEDAAAIRRIHDDLVASGAPNPAERAIEEHLSALASDRSALVADIEAQGGKVLSGIVYARAESTKDIARQISITSILDNTETLEIPGAKKTKAGKLRATALQLARALEARTLRANRGRHLGARTARSKEIVAEAISLEVQAALERTGNAGDWYSTVLHNAVAIASEIHPELKTDVEARSLFLLGLAITSNGMDVDSNSEAGEEVYAFYKKNNRFPSTGYGPQGASMADGFRLANQIINDWGIKDFVKLLNTEFTVAELNNLGFDVSGENVDFKTYGSVVFGPKVGGGFFQNLMGNFNPLTMDRWFMRTWGRLTGTITPSTEMPEAQVDRLVAAINADPATVEAAGFSVSEVMENDFALLELAAHFNRVYAKSSSKFSKTYGDKTELNQAAKNLHLSMTSPVIAPRNGEERNWIREVAALAMEKLQERGITINAASMQALVWYPEKDLYLNHGVGNAKSKPTDYEQEFEKIARARGVDQSRIDAARSVAGAERSADAARRDASPEASVEEPLAPAFTEKERRSLIRRTVSLRAREQLPRHHRGRVGRGAERNLEGTKVKRVYTPVIRAKNAFDLAGMSTPTILELESSPASAQLFTDKITAAKNSGPYGAAASIYPQNEYENMRLFLSQDGSAGFALDGDDIISVFNKIEGPHSGVSQALVSLAVSEGGRRLDTFDTLLPATYSMQGFRVVARLPWNEQYKPDGWSKKTFDRWGNGEPDLVFMVFDRSHKGVYTGQYEGEYVSSNDEAITAQKNEVDKLAERNKPDIRYRLEEEVDEVVRRDPSSPLARAHKLGATVEDQMGLGSWHLTRAKILESIAEKGVVLTLKSVPRRALLDFLPKSLAPSLHRYVMWANRMNGRRNELMEPAEAIARKWSSWARANKRMAGRLADIMHASTLAGVDPSVDEYIPLKKAKNMSEEDKKIDTLRREEHRILKEFYGKLDDTGKGLYNEVRNFYAKQRLALEAALQARIDASGADSKSKRVLQDLLQQKFEAGRVAGPYFPLARFGDQWASIKDLKGEVIAFSRFETIAEQKAWLSSWRDVGYSDANFDRGQKSDSNLDALSTVDPQFVAKVQSLVAGDSALQDEIWQLYLRSLPEMSMRKRFLHRKGRLGFSADALRAFASTSFHGAHQQSKLEFSHQLESEMRGLHEEVREIERTTENASRYRWAMPLYNEMKNRHSLAMSPRAGSWAITATSLGFVFYLGATPAAAVVNLTQTAIVGLPVLAARFNALGAAKELAAATKLYVSSRGRLENKLRGAEYDAIAEARRIGLFEKTQAHELAGVSEAGTDHYGGTLHTVMQVSSWMFHKAEQMNREVTFLAAYRLAIQSGELQADAVTTAEDLTWDSHFDYNNDNRPSIMQSDVGRVALLFKQYPLNMSYRLARDFRDGFLPTIKDATQRKEAKTRFMGMLMMTTLLGGLSSLPLVHAVGLILDTLFGGDDDEIRAEDALRIHLTDMFSPKVAEIIMKGPVDALTPITLSNRISLNNLWMRDPSPYEEDESIISRILETVAGPVVGQLEATARGVGDIAEGNVGRGLERIVPKAVRDLLKTQRYSQEGALTVHTPPDTLVPQENMSAWDLGAQALGFTPSKLTLQYEQNNITRRADKRITDRRNRAIATFQLGLLTGDKGAMAEGNRLISEFSKRYPELAITGKGIESGAMTRIRRNAMARGGVSLPAGRQFLHGRTNISEEE